MSESVTHAKVAIVGAGPAGSATALHLAQLGVSDVAIVDLHDCWPRRTSTDRDRTPTVEALAVILPELAARGFRGVTVSELVAM